MEKCGVTNTVISKHGIPIRLTIERWEHIVTQHTELVQFRQEVLDTVAQPEQILAGSNEEKLAVREITSGKWLVVVYRETLDDGFIVTAFWTRRHRALAKREILWSR